MVAKQLSIFLENKSGRLTEVTEVLAKENINLSALCIAENADFGILRAAGVPQGRKRRRRVRNAPFENILIGRNEEIAVPDREKILSGPRLRDFERLEDMLRLRSGRLETPVGIDDSVDIEVGVMVLAASEIAAV